MAPVAAGEGFASPISLAAPTTAGASPASPQEAEEVDEFTMGHEAEEPKPAMDGKAAQDTLLRVSKGLEPTRTACRSVPAHVYWHPQPAMQSCATCQNLPVAG